MNASPPMALRRQAIRARLEEATGGSVTPGAEPALGPEGLRVAGLSRPKAIYALSIAGEFASRCVSLRRIARMPDKEAAALLALR